MLVTSTGTSNVKKMVLQTDLFLRKLAKYVSVVIQIAITLFTLLLKWCKKHVMFVKRVIFIQVMFVKYRD